MEITKETSPSPSVVGQNEVVRLFVRELTVLDYAYWDAHSGPLGGSLDVDVTFVGLLDHEGVVFDFSLAKKAVKSVIDDLCDHRFVVPKNCLEMEPEGQGDEALFRAKYVNGELFYRCPKQGFCAIDTDKVTLGAIKRYLEAEVMKVMPQNVDAVEIELREELLEDAPFYRYTHGLKQHYGNCQRLVHGHCNRVDVFVEGERSLALEKKVAERFSNVHLAFPENILSSGALVGQRQDHLEEVELSYRSSQGEFFLRMPGCDVYAMPLETTVENISRHIRDCVEDALKGERVEVFAYEGIRKGARSRSL
jgi:6-pyruvoyl-tetrahydropterin synthase